MKCMERRFTCRGRITWEMLIQVFLIRIEIMAFIGLYGIHAPISGGRKIENYNRKMS